MTEQADTKRPLSYGEKAVGIQFNPSGDANVNTAKQLSAQLIDLINDTRSPNDSRFLNGLATAAVNAVVTAQMLVVKVITWREE